MKLMRPWGRNGDQHLSGSKKKPAFSGRAGKRLQLRGSYGAVVTFVVTPAPGPS
jgi:hypothetical protein